MSKCPAITFADLTHVELLRLLTNNPAVLWGLRQEEFVRAKWDVAVERKTQLEQLASNARQVEWTAVGATLKASDKLSERIDSLRKLEVAKKATAAAERRAARARREEEALWEAMSATWPKHESEDHVRS